MRGEFVDVTETEDSVPVEDVDEELESWPFGEWFGVVPTGLIPIAAPELQADSEASEEESVDTAIVPEQRH